MCRFLVSKYKSIPRPDELNIFKSALNIMLAGGPDGQNIERHESILFGHNRLALFDLSERGRQPFNSSCGRYKIVYNGEIYNHQDIRNKLARYSIQWKSSSDTETLIEAIRCIGLKESLKLTHGMFSLVLFDKLENLMYLCTDRVGVKPLFYSINNSKNFFVASSEVRPIINILGKENLTINDYASFEYFSYGYIRSPKTVFKEIHSLPPATILKYELNNNSAHSEIWWEPEINPEKYRSKTNNLRNIISNSLEKRIKSDVNVPLFLSGGIDSTLLLYLAKNDLGLDIQCYTASFPGSIYDETSYATEAAKRLGISDHSIEILNPTQDVIDYIKTIGFHLDQPFGDSSLIVTHLLCKAIRRDGNKCYLGADGADELFWGYKKYHKLLIAQFIEFYLPNLIKEKILKAPNKTAENINDRYDSNKYILVQKLINSNIYNQGISNNITNILSPIDIMGLDLRNYLVGDILTKCDRASMQASVENREPFLDQEIINWSKNNMNRKRNLIFDSKKPLKRILANEFPRSFLNRRKQGFATPIQEWISKSSDLNHHFLSQLTFEKLNMSNLSLPEELKSMIDNITKLDDRNFNFLWSIYIWVTFFESIK